LGVQFAVIVVAFGGMVKVVEELLPLVNVPPLDVLQFAKVYPVFAPASIEKDESVS
jgi:hypothetical protein